MGGCSNFQVPSRRALIESLSSQGFSASVAQVQVLLTLLQFDYLNWSWDVDFIHEGFSIGITNMILFVTLSLFHG
jgi:hypothetical protein